jgi:hypothetical protein
MRTATTVLLALGTVLTAQAPAPDKTPKWRIDPFTKNKPEALTKAGYLNYGPFKFGNKADTPTPNTQIDDALPHVQILWVETAHFRIGSNLPAWTVPQDPVVRAKIRRELELLAERIPGVDPKTKLLSPWLRLHLTAQRLETLYKEVSDLFGVTDADFPTDASKVIRQPGARYMGYGPYLGMKDKYLVLMFEKMGPYQTYMQTFLGRDSKYGQRWHFKETSSILYTTATECDEGRNKDDTALHGALAFDVGQNLLDGFRYYSYDLPVWIREGFGHWLNRRIAPQFPNFDQNEGSIADMKKVTRWEVYCRNMVGTPGKYAPFADVFTWRDFGKITFNDHVAIWSRIDWLMSQGPEKWRKFLFEVKGRVDDQWFPDQNDLVGATRTALQQAYGLSALNFDEKWVEWVKASYPVQ